MTNRMRPFFRCVLSVRMLLLLLLPGTRAFLVGPSSTLRTTHRNDATVVVLRMSFSSSNSIHNFQDFDDEYRNLQPYQSPESDPDPSSMPYPSSSTSSTTSSTPAFIDLTPLESMTTSGSAPSSSTSSKMTTSSSSSTSPEPPTTPTTETPLQAALVSLFQDKTLADVKFRGSDGKTVLGYRALLAARSTVFRSMFYGTDALKPKHSETLVVPAKYASPILTSVVQYCLTDEAEVLNEGQVNAHTLVALLEAAEYFGLDTFREKVSNKITTTMESNPETVCIFLEETGNVPQIRNAAMDLIRAYPNETLLLKNAVQYLSQPRIEAILKDDQMQADEITMFRILQTWSTGGEKDPSERIRAAKKMTHYLDFLNIPLHEVEACVEPSGLLSEQQLLQVFKSLAKKTETDPFQKRFRHRIRGTWRESRTEELSFGPTSQIIDPMPKMMKSGVWAWSVEVISGSDDVWLGIISSTHFLNETPRFPGGAGTWAYRSRGEDGCCIHNNVIARIPYRGFTDGSVVRMTLDLREAGVLSVSVDDGSTFFLADNILREFGMGQEVGFVPAATLLYSTCRIKFLGFDVVPP